MNAARCTKKKETCFLWSAFLALLLLMSSVAAVNVHLRTKAETHIASAQNAICNQLYANMEKCVRIGKKMDIAGADIRGSLLPELKMYLYALEQITALTSEETPLFAPAMIRCLWEDCAALENRYAAGFPYEECVERLTRDLRRLDDLLSHVA